MVVVVVVVVVVIVIVENDVVALAVYNYPSSVITRSRDKGNLHLPT